MSEYTYYMNGPRVWADHSKKEDSGDLKLKVLIELSYKFSVYCFLIKQSLKVLIETDLKIHSTFCMYVPPTYNCSTKQCDIRCSIAKTVWN